MNELIECMRRALDEPDNLLRHIYSLEQKADQNNLQTASICSNCRFPFGFPVKKQPRSITNSNIDEPICLVREKL